MNNRLFINNETTLQQSEEQKKQTRHFTLKILYHPDLQRVGEVALLDVSTPVMLSRTETLFAPPGEPPTNARPLNDPYLSRQSLILKALSGCAEGPVQFLPSPRVRVKINGRLLSSEYVMDNTALEKGVVITLAERVLLLLRSEWKARYHTYDTSFVGYSQELQQLIHSIYNISSLDLPVVIRGEVGVGKTLVASEIAKRTRPQKPFTSVRCSTVDQEDARYRLWGSVINEATGIAEERGLFEEADGGTLFLDEVESLPLEAQELVERVLQNGTIWPAGAAEARHVDVRVVAATSLDLDDLDNSSTFSTPLLKRLVRFHQVWVPPLRERREDIGLLLIHFLDIELRRIPTWEPLLPEQRLRKIYEWLPTDLVERIACYYFPENVRELKKIVNDLVVTSAHCEKARISDRWNLRLKSTLDKIEEINVKTEVRTESDQSFSPNGESVTRDKDNLPMPDPRKVFVVSGRNTKARDAFFAFLRSLDLDPIEWESARSMAENANAYIGEILDTALGHAQAILVLFTGDDEARLLKKYYRQGEDEMEMELLPQSRPNVLFEAGMAIGRAPDHTVLVEIDHLRPFSDLAGRYTVRMRTGSASERHLLVERLREAGCQPKTSGRIDWLNGDFFKGVFERVVGRIT